MTFHWQARDERRRKEHKKARDARLSMLEQTEDEPAAEAAAEVCKPTALRSSRTPTSHHPARLRPTIPHT